jgi:hypothetical protein
VLGLLVIYALVIANWTWPIIRFTSPTLNALVLLAAFVLPWIALVCATRFPSLWARGAAMVVLAPLLLYTAFFGFFLVLNLVDLVKDGRDPSFAPLAAVAMDGYRVGLYRTNGGATTSFGVAVRQERQLAPGLLLVRQLHGFYPASEARYEVLARDRIRVSVPEYTPDRPETAESRVYRLNPRVYF